MAPITNVQDLAYFQIETLENPNPKTEGGTISADSLVFPLSAPLQDELLGDLTKPFVLTFIDSQTKKPLSVYVKDPSTELSSDKQTITLGNLTQKGIQTAGENSIDFESGDESRRFDLSIGSSVRCSISALTQKMLANTILGLLATGGAVFYLGNGTDQNYTYGYRNSAGNKGLIRINKDTNKAQYSNDGGSVWIDIDNAGVGVIVGGDGIALTAGNTTINIDTTDKTVFIKEPETYTPAFLTGGSSATTSMVTWNGTTDGTFSITIDGVLRDITGLNFSGDTDLDDVALNIQTAIRTATGALETVVWDTDHFAISSVDTASTSAITVCSAEGTGTDISGAGGTTYMDCDTGNGVVTNKILNQSADEDKVPVLDSAGLLNSLFVPIVKDLTATAVEINQALDGINANVTPTNLNAVTSGVNADTQHTHQQAGNFSVGLYQKTLNVAGTFSIPHSLGVSPKMIKVSYSIDQGNISSYTEFQGHWINGINQTIALNAGGLTRQDITNKMIQIQESNGSANGGYGIVSSVDSSDIDIDWTLFGTPSGALVNILWEAFA